MDYIVEQKNGAAIQQAIDTAAAAGGGRVVLEPGIYPSGTIYLKSNIELHIPAGAKILGHPTAEMYEDYIPAGLEKVTPENSCKCLIACDHCENIAITGQGTIDGQGPEYYDKENFIYGRFWAKKNMPRPRLVQFYKCSNVLMTGITLFNSPGWTCWLVDCEDVHVDKIRIIGEQRMINNDGIDFDSCRRVTVSDSFFKTGDDCLVLRAIRRNDTEPSVCEHVTVTNCILDSACQGIRLGCPSDDTIRYCSFSRINLKSLGVGIYSQHPYCYLRSNCFGYMDIHDLTFDDFDIESASSPLAISCDPGITLRGIKNFIFSNIRIRAAYPMHFDGNVSTILENIVLKNVTGVINYNTPLMTKFVRNLEMENCKLSAETGEPEEFTRQKTKGWETA